jgi:hypothetical protein
VLEPTLEGQGMRVEIVGTRFPWRGNKDSIRACTCLRKRRIRSEGSVKGWCVKRSWMSMGSGDPFWVYICFCY